MRCWSLCRNNLFRINQFDLVSSQVCLKIVVLVPIDESLLNNLRTDSSSFTFFRQVIVYFMSLRTDSSSFRLVAAVSAVRGPLALAHLPNPARAVCGTGPQMMRESREFPGKHAPRRPTTSPVSSPLSVVAGGPWSIGTPASRGRTCRPRPTFMGVMRWRKKDLPD